MSGDFLVWRPGNMRDGVCKLMPPLDVAKSYQIDEGVSRLATWKKTARSLMDPAFPKDIALADSLYGASFVVVSGAVRRALEAEAVQYMEYLPLQIVNHKGRVASNDQHIVNSLRIVDCIDDAASNTGTSHLVPGAITECDRLVLRPGAIPLDALIFRPERWRELLLIRRELAARLLGAGFAALRFVEPDQYTGLT